MFFFTTNSILILVSDLLVKLENKQSQIGTRISYKFKTRAGLFERVSYISFESPFTEYFFIRLDLFGRHSSPLNIFHSSFGHGVRYLKAGHNILC